MSMPHINAMIQLYDTPPIFRGAYAGSKLIGQQMQQGKTYEVIMQLLSSEFLFQGPFWDLEIYHWRKWERALPCVFPPLQFLIFFFSCLWRCVCVCVDVRGGRYVYIYELMALLF